MTETISGVGQTPDDVRTLPINAAASDGGPQGGMLALLRVIGRHKPAFALTFLTFMAAAAAVIGSLQPAYQSQTMLLLRLRAPHLSEVQASASSGSADSDMNFVRSEIQVLRSEALARRVVLSLGLDTNARFQPVPSALERVRSDVSGWIAGVLGTRWTKAEPTGNALDKAVGRYLAQLGAGNDGKSYIINLSFTAADASFAQQILSEHLRLYLEDQVAEKEAGLDRVQGWLEGELGRLDTKVQGEEQRLQEFRDANALTRRGGETVIGRQLTEVMAQLGAARADLARKQARLDEIRSVRDGGADPAVLASPLIQKLREQEALQQSNLAHADGQYGAAHPLARQLAAGLAATRDKIAIEVSRQLASAQSDVSAARGNINLFKQTIDSLTQQATTEEKSSLMEAEIQRGLDADRQLYGELLRRSKQVAIERRAQEPEARVVSAPSLPFQPAFPHRGMLMAVSVCAATVTGGLAALALDRRRRPSLSLADLEAASRLPSLGVIPYVPTRGRGSSVVAAMQSQSHLAAALHTIRNSLSLARQERRQPKVVMFTSGLPGEGKTFVSACYARSLARSGQRVLLIDTDVRRGGLGNLLGRQSGPGLVSLLSGKADLRDCVRHLQGLSLDVLLVEQAVESSYDLLSSPRMVEMLRDARAEYDAVIIDTPPVAAIDDAVILAPSMDAAIVIARWGQTPHEVMWGVARRLRLAGVPLIGCVLNAAKLSGYPSDTGDLEAYRPMHAGYLRGTA